MQDEYRPIDCGLHDHLEAAAVTARICELVYEEEGRRITTTSRILDVTSRDGAEFVLLERERVVRLDRILRLDGVAFEPPSSG